ncbi:hypothetical protein CK203_115150 [Vitis vinifera]|uniref:Uncharacterized protein n=1 Tax=Vitis vinifera TaxID=29760 RepID=A0A438C9T1_VITVI|nr:hypothetical protein CK203_115150 [Vitis vinifera]
MTPKVVIRQPMVTQPPIEGNLDCRARSFHFELCFDRETFRDQPELKDSFHLLQRGTSTRSFLLRKKLSPSMFPLDALLHHNIFPLQHMRRSTKEATESICNSTAIPEVALSDTRSLGLSFEPQLERRRIFREIFTLDKWTIVPATFALHPSESSIAISISEFRGLCQTLQTLTVLRAFAQQMAVVRAHQDQLSPPRPSILSSLDSMSLRRYHFLPVFSIALATLRNVQLGWGKRVEEGSFAFNAKLFW